MVKRILNKILGWVNKRHPVGRAVIKILFFWITSFLIVMLLKYIEVIKPDEKTYTAGSQVELLVT
jgi:hypothetical protein